MKKNSKSLLIIPLIVLLSIGFLAKSNIRYFQTFGSNFNIGKYILMLEMGVKFEETKENFEQAIYESSFIPNFIKTMVVGDEDEPDTENENPEILSFEIKNNANKLIDKSAILSNPYDPKVELNSTEPQILIIHTHGTESYDKDGAVYEESGDRRTTNEEYNMQKVAQTLVEILNENGINTLYSSDLHDYPSYVNSYSNSAKTVTEYLEKYPSLKLIIDVHRDAVVYENGEHLGETVTINGEKVAKMMLVIGSDGSGLEHDHYMTNLNIGANIHAQIEANHEGLMRPLFFNTSRYNQHLSKGQILLEIGYSGNTLTEALNAVEYFAEGLLDYINT